MPQGGFLLMWPWSTQTLDGHTPSTLTLRVFITIIVESRPWARHTQPTAASYYLDADSERRAYHSRGGRSLVSRNNVHPFWRLLSCTFLPHRDSPQENLVHPLSIINQCCARHLLLLPTSRSSGYLREFLHVRGSAVGVPRRYW